MAAKNTLLYFSAEWCGPCRTVGPIMDGIKADGTPVIKVDVDEQRSLAEKYNVRNIPTIVGLDTNGNELGRITGAHPKESYLNLING